MGLNPQKIQRLPHVEAVLNHLAPMTKKPFNLAYEPAPGEPRSNGRPEPHRVPIFDMRPVAAQFAFDREGIALVEAASAQHDFYDEDEVRRVYYPECTRLVLEATGGYALRSSITRSAAASGAERPRAGRAASAGDPGPQRLYDQIGPSAGT
jgi:hypothetical protein